MSHDVTIIVGKQVDLHPSTTSGLGTPMLTFAFTVFLVRFSRIWAEYGDLLCIFPLFGKIVETLYSPYSVVMQDNGPKKLQRWILFKKRSGYFQKEMYNISSSSTLFSRKILLQEVLKSVATTAFLCDKKHALWSILFSNSDSETLL